MPENKKQKKINKWKLVINNEKRQAYLECPRCKNTVDYDILGYPKKCKYCGLEMEGQE